jgi:hypothetical protein
LTKKIKFKKKIIFHSATLRWTALGLIRSEKIGNAYRIMSSDVFVEVEDSQRYEDNIKQDYKEKDCENVNRTMMALVHYLV